MKSKYFVSNRGCVAPHAGAWIEIMARATAATRLLVAPHAGAWIEIYGGAANKLATTGRTPRGCVD